MSNLQDKIAIQEYRPSEHSAPKRELVDEPLSIINVHLVVPERPGLVLI